MMNVGNVKCYPFRMRDPDGNGIEREEAASVAEEGFF
jgi:hypothetical protein